MAEKLTTFVWRHSARDQLALLALTILSFPVIWISLELPKIIINEAIGGEDFPKVVLGFELEQIEYLVALCFAYLAAISLNNGIKYVTNLQRGILGERMLRRMRFELFRRVMGRPLSRLRGTSPGELVQLVSAELAPIGDFIGAIIATPLSQGGSFLVYLSFIIAQNPFIGAAALALYPVQAWIVPKLQNKVIAMIRERLANIRAMAREIDESIDGAVEVRALRARRWHMAIVSRQLYDNYRIRRRIFILKFLIKFVNNVANHITPFFIFLIGGWFVIEGRLNIGALTAVLIAYKDLAAPWKELLRFYQDYSDMSARYTNVMENFDEDAEPAPLLEEAPTGPHAVELKEAKVHGLRSPVSCHVPHGAVAAVVGEDAGERTALLQALSGLVDGLSETWTAGTPILYRAAVYVPPDPRVFTGTIRANLLQGLRFRPVAQADDEQSAERRREAALTGAPADDVDDQWIDPQEAGYADNDEIEARMLELARELGLEDDLYTIGLGLKVDPTAEPELAEKLLALRRRIAADEELGAMRRDFIAIWREDEYNPNGTIGENLFFALPVDSSLRWADFADEREVLRALDHAGVRRLAVEIGLDACEALLSLFEGVSAESDLFRRFALFPRAETPVIEQILRKGRQKGPTRLSRAEQIRMIGIAFSYSSARYRLGILRGKGDRVQQLLKARPRLAGLVEGDSRFARFDPEAYHPAFTIADNIFFGPVKIERRDSWQPFKSRVDDLVAELGLRELILHAGLDQPIGEGGVALNAQQRRRLGLARALMKKPVALVIDQIAAGDSAADEALRALLKHELDAGAPDGQGALVFGAAREDAAAPADHVIRIDGGGRVTEESREAGQPDAGRAAPAAGGSG